MRNGSAVGGGGGGAGPIGPTGSVFSVRGGAGGGAGGAFGWNRNGFRSVSPSAGISPFKSSRRTFSSFGSIASACAFFGSRGGAAGDGETAAPSLHIRVKISATTTAPSAISSHDWGRLFRTGLSVVIASCPVVG